MYSSLCPTPHWDRYAYDKYVNLPRAVCICTQMNQRRLKCTQPKLHCGFLTKLSFSKCLKINVKSQIPHPNHGCVYCMYFGDNVSFENGDILHAWNEILLSHNPNPYSPCMLLVVEWLSYCLLLYSIPATYSGCICSKVAYSCHKEFKYSWTDLTCMCNQLCSHSAWFIIQSHFSLNSIVSDIKYTLYRCH